MTSIEEKGKLGEQALNDWLRYYGLSYLYIAQSPDTFSALFPGAVKRPDFLILLDSIGLIAVDAKNYALSGGVYTLALERELRRAVTFERVFRIPVWYAFLNEGKDPVWWWISALKAVEVGDVRKREDNQEEFLAIRVESFAGISTNEDLGKLYTERLPGLGNVKKL